jgi:hypothetical protein
MAAEVRRLAGVFHLNHHAVILDECDGRPCSECGSYVCLVVEPYSLCYVSVQPEMERGRSPLLFRPSAGISKASIRSPGYPSAWLLSRRARFRFAWQDHCSSVQLHCFGGRRQSH